MLKFDSNRAQEMGPAYEPVEVKSCIWHWGDHMDTHFTPTGQTYQRSVSTWQDKLHRSVCERMCVLVFVCITLENQVEY